MAGLHLVGHAVHRVGADEDAFGAGALEAMGRRRSVRPVGGVPVAGVLQRFDLAEVERPEETSGGVHTAAAPRADTLVDEAVILGGALPTHAADQADDLQRHSVTPTALKKV